MSKGYLTTHVLDTYSGKPGSNIKGAVYRIKEDKKIKISDFSLNEDGRCSTPIVNSSDFEVGQYEITFYCGEYFQSIENLKKPYFIDEVVIKFGVNNDTEHYHVPLLVTPWSYTTYRGS